jgi:hypothetical protein
VMAWDPKRQHEGGYLIIDHRASPGLPEDIARLSGFDPAMAGEGKLLEHSTLTCSHCKCAVVKNPLRTRAREYCPKCDHYVCDFCYADMQHPDYTHMPFEKFSDLTMRGKPPLPVRLKG